MLHIFARSGSVEDQVYKCVNFTHDRACYVAECLIGGTVDSAYVVDIDTGEIAFDTTKDKFVRARDRFTSSR